MHEVESQRTQKSASIRILYCGHSTQSSHAVGNLFGILAYADDVTLMAPSAAAVRRLLQNAARGVASLFAARGGFHICRLILNTSCEQTLGNNLHFSCVFSSSGFYLSCQLFYCVDA